MAAPVSALDGPAPLAVIETDGEATAPAETEIQPEPQPPASPDLFGTRGVPFRGSSPDARWARVAAPALDMRLAWLVAGARGLGPKQQAIYVQTAVNRGFAYRADAQNWGEGDYWATADETIARRAGDCEDMAIVKMQALRLLGFAPRDLYLVTGRNRAGAQHALLAVRIDESFWVLDDGSAMVVPAASYHAMAPVITYGDGWKWVHGHEVTPEQAARTSVAVLQGVVAGR
jgi:predicted transglutaminase-like cysteine proteinase